MRLAFFLDHYAPPTASYCPLNLALWEFRASKARKAALSPGGTTEGLQQAGDQLESHGAEPAQERKPQVSWGVVGRGGLKLLTWKAPGRSS